MGDHGLVAAELSRLRRSAHEFLRRHAARAWEHQHDGVRWDITLPPDVAGLPEHERYRAHARQEARRLAVAQLYDLDVQITALAAGHGAAIRQGGTRRPSRWPVIPASPRRWGSIRLRLRASCGGGIRPGSDTTPSGRRSSPATGGVTRRCRCLESGQFTA